MPEEKPQQNWLSSLSEEARARRPRPTADANDDGWAGSLSEEARTWVDSNRADRPQGPPVEKVGGRYCCVESASGEYPVVRVFKTAEDLAAHVGSIEGRDVAVVLFYGRHLRVSSGPLRVMETTDPERVMIVPPNPMAQPQLVDADDIDIVWQADGFLGPPELASHAAMRDRLDGLAADGQEPSAAEDDEDEDDG